MEKVLPEAAAITTSCRIEDQQFFAFLEGQELIDHAKAPTPPPQVEPGAGMTPLPKPMKRGGKAQRQTQKRGSGLPVDAGGNKPQTEIMQKSQTDPFKST